MFRWFTNNLARKSISFTVQLLFLLSESSRKSNAFSLVTKALLMVQGECRAVYLFQLTFWSGPPEYYIFSLQIIIFTEAKWLKIILLTLKTKLLVPSWMSDNYHTWRIMSHKIQRRTVWLLNIHALSNVWNRVELPYDIRCLIQKKGYHCLAVVNTGTTSFGTLLLWILLQSVDEKRISFSVLLFPKSSKISFWILQSRFFFE